MRISDWSSDVCSSDLRRAMAAPTPWVAPVTMKTGSPGNVLSMPRSAPPRARRAGQPGAGPGGSDVPFVTENEIPVRLSEFYDIFISWSHAGRRQPWHSGTLVGADGNLEQRAAPARPSGGVKQAATNEIGRAHV